MTRSRFLKIIKLLPWWYLTRSRHFGKERLVGKYWKFVSRRHWWMPYDESLMLKIGITDYIQQQLFYNGVYETVVAEWLKKQLRTNDIFWDVGANIGAMTLIASKRCKHVYAFEPAEKTRNHLLFHINANKLTNVSVLPLALSDTTGEVRLNYGPPSNSGMAGIARDCGYGSELAMCFRADDLLTSERDIQPPNIIKIDVEGAEKLVFSGGRDLLKSPQLRQIVFESAANGEDSPADPELVEVLTNFGFELKTLGKSDPSSTDPMLNFVASRPPEH